jgi:MoxR-like ATPase
VIDKTIMLVASTRPNRDLSSAMVKKYVAWGAGPRASQYLILGAKARAALDARYSPNFDDVIQVAHPVLRHRIITNFTAEAEGIKSDNIIEELLKTVQ